METTPINNALPGFVGGVNASAPAELPSTEEKNSLDFLTVLKNIVGAESLKGQADDAEGTATNQQRRVPASLSPVLPALLQKALIENGKNREGEGGDFKEGLSKEHVAEEGDTGSLEIHFAGANAASISGLLRLVTILCDALNEPGSVDMSVKQAGNGSQDEGATAGPGDKSYSDKPSGSHEKRGAMNDAILSLLTFVSEALAGMKVEQTAGNGDGETTVAPLDSERPTSKLEGNDEKELSGRPELQGLIESALAPQIANVPYTSTEQFVAKKEGKGEGLHISTALEKTSPKRVVLTIGSSEGKSDSLLQGITQKEFGDQTDDKIEALFRSLTDMAARKDIRNNDAAFSNRLLAGTDGGDGSDNRNAARILLSPEEKALMETVVKLKEATEPQVKEVKASSRENEYLPFSKDATPENSSLQEAQSHKVLKETAFASVMTERIEKIVEQFSAKGSNMDMILAAFSNRLLAGTDGGDGSDNRNAARILLSPEEKALMETVVKLKEATEPQVKEVKASSRENEYLPFSKDATPENSSLQEAQSHKVLKETAFASVMTERIEKIVEQFSAKGSNMDMILRLKIDDRETLLVGLRNEGQKVMVDVKTTNEGALSILQTQKDVISRNLEEKHVYTNIYIDPDGNGSFERRESRGEKKRKEQESGRRTDFVELFEASA